MEIDASEIGIGAISSQQNHLVAYFFEKDESCIAMAISLCARTLCTNRSSEQIWHYLLGHKFIIHTDQEALKHLCSQTIQTPKQQRWLPKLLGYDFQIEYKLGKDNLGAEALSRSFYLALSSIHYTLIDQLQQLQQQDSRCVFVINSIVVSDSQDTSFSYSNNLLYKQGKLVVPNHAEIRKLLLQEFHNSPMGGHVGSMRTYAQLAA